MQKENKKNELDIMTVVFCILVIFIHVSYEPVTMLPPGTLSHIIIFGAWRLSAFVVQGFIMISAVKFFIKIKDGKFRYLPFVINRIKTIVIPYLLAVTIYYMFLCQWGYYSFNFKELFAFTLRGNLVSHFYFIITIMQFYILMPIWIKLVKNIKPYIAIPAALAVGVVMGRFFPDFLALFGIKFIFNDRVFTTYIFYWVTGCYIGIGYEKFTQIFSKLKALSISAFVITAAANFILSYINATKKTIIWLEYVHIIYVICAIFLAFTIGFVFKSKKNKLFDEISRASFNIYLVHCLFIYILNNKFYEAGLERILYRYGLRILFVYIFSVGGCILYGYVKKKIKEFDKKLTES